MIIQYARNEDGTPNGALVAEKIDEEGTVLVGWSGYNLSGEPKPFTKEEAIRIAKNRIEKGFSGCTVPRRMRPMLDPFVDRCRRYFKTDCVLVVGYTYELKDFELEQ